MEETSENEPLPKKARLLESPEVDCDNVDAMDETFESDCKLDEIFRRVPVHVLEELFDFLDIRHGTRLCRVSPGWKSLLTKIPARNNGIAVLQEPSDRKTSDKLNDTLSLTKVWTRDMFLVPPESLTHFIFVGNFREGLVNMTALWEDFTRRDYIISPSLKKITYCMDDVLHQDSWWLMPPSVQSVAFVNCTFHLNDHHFNLSSQDEYLKAMVSQRAIPPARTSGNPWRNYARYGIMWHLKVLILRLEVPHSAVMQAPTWGSTQAIHEDEFMMGSDPFMRAWTANWKWLKKVLDDKHLIWPYADEQLQWLLGLLDTLEGSTLLSVKSTDKVWKDMGVGESIVSGDYRTLDLTTTASCDGRKLQTIDLAFFGRLLVTMNKAKAIPGFQSPPFEFPDDFEYSEM